MNSKIDSKDISIIVQGQLFKSEKSSTLDVLLSIRKNYPNAEVILSTWNGSCIPAEYLSLCDQIVLSDDPGDGTYGKTPLNINRQIISSRAGLEKATRSYAIKTRTDLIFTSNTLAQFMGLNLERSPEFSVGNGHICVADFSTRSHVSGLKVPFWVCDFVYAGRREDVTTVFDVKLYLKHDFEYYLNNPKPEYMYRQSDVFQYTPETYFAYYYLKQGRDIPFENSYDSNSVAMGLYCNLLVNNFIVLGEKQLGVTSLKYHLPIHPPRKIMTYPVWAMLYSKQYRSRLPRPNYLQNLVEYVKYKCNKRRKSPFK
ncbi:WavE lipopolysaccharide synthesis family protein [Aliivibrio sp. S3MY1]|uniref:WavE lipopolysaccharide synthesis family protein n=1 Tax=unclassified Aliivibrio TaxID=2645654 RepID=UPI00237A01E3|nr:MULTISPECIES: WavE lipopolysaccharide synthesis family protein [unclassified Aliivibrio]MDD9196684.1 WavE lipopolysaccharide synthesis family protein [Aliivibrio sp. S3MY1]MDD9199825.1 WavE lipopolysaccharide synthesis family protein [Aliivibrio sp. S2MY1]